MRYLIPVKNLEKLEKKLQTIKNKGGHIAFEIGEEKMVPDPTYPTINHKCVEVYVNGSYCINGWVFVATIEHTANGNIIRCIDRAFDGKIPEKYKTSSPECEHCHRIRDRKDTYLVYHNELTLDGCDDDSDNPYNADHFKQVGKSCLKEYTGGLDAEVIASMMSSLDLCDKASALDMLPLDDLIGSSNASYKYISNEYLKRFAYNYIKDEGYVKEITKNKVAYKLINKYTEKEKATDLELAEIDNWVKLLNVNNDYLYNATVAWKREYVEFRDFALILSLMNQFFKEKARIEENKLNPSNYVGRIGQRISISISSYKILFENSYRVSYNVTAVSYTYQIKDPSGNIYILKSSKPLDELNMYNEEMNSFHIARIKPITIEATVKDFKEYKGIKQTILERFKLKNFEEIRK